MSWTETFLERRNQNNKKNHDFSSNSQAKSDD